MCGFNEATDLKCLDMCQIYSKHLISATNISEVIDYAGTRPMCLHGVFTGI